MYFYLLVVLIIGVRLLLHAVVLEIGFPDVYPSKLNVYCAAVAFYDYCINIVLRNLNPQLN